MCRCHLALCIWLLSLTGSAVSSLAGNCPIHLKRIFCVTALELAFEYGQPYIFNTDQGAQFTANAFTVPLLARDIRISMDGRGRALDNIFIERLWRSVKYEDIYIKKYESVRALRAGLEAYFQLYNYERPHQSLTYATPAEIYFGDDHQLS